MSTTNTIQRTPVNLCDRVVATVVTGHDRDHDGRLAPFMQLEVGALDELGCSWMATAFLSAPQARALAAALLQHASRFDRLIAEHQGGHHVAAA